MTDAAFIELTLSPEGDQFALAIDDIVAFSPTVLKIDGKERAATAVSKRIVMQNGRHMALIVRESYGEIRRMLIAAGATVIGITDVKAPAAEGLRP